LQGKGASDRSNNDDPDADNLNAAVDGDANEEDEFSF
jgi:hypothetical protein